MCFDDLDLQIRHAMFFNTFLTILNISESATKNLFLNTSLFLILNIAVEGQNSLML